MRVNVWADKQAFVDSMMADHHLDEDQKKKADKLVASTKDLMVMVAGVPDSPSRDEAIKYLQLVLFFSIRAIEGNGNY